MVQQHLAKDTDINTIMAKYAKTGQFTHVTPMAGEYGDFSNVPDYKSAMEQIMAADALFMELPAKVRERFGNDPANFIEFATNDKNIEELRKLGLAPPAPLPPEPQLVKVVEEPEALTPKKARRETSDVPLFLTGLTDTFVSPKIGVKT